MDEVFDGFVHNLLHRVGNINMLHLFNGDLNGVRNGDRHIIGNLNPFLNNPVNRVGARSVNHLLHGVGYLDLNGNGNLDGVGNWDLTVHNLLDRHIYGVWYGLVHNTLNWNGHLVRYLGDHLTWMVNHLLHNLLHGIGNGFVNNSLNGVGHRLLHNLFHGDGHVNGHGNVNGTGDRNRFLNNLLNWDRHITFNNLLHRDGDRHRLQHLIGSWYGIVNGNFNRNWDINSVGNRHIVGLRNEQEHH
eukprot:NODE_602_length_1334_cov_80.158244_g563_i0.p1 GENE.NODE_602_length_1334_cov_80.158244_g563_i0~~NODE_602_length_1334_cov_80.158244_g563_i0.p1  ORF type:complete len:244 (+),score=24.22 NODE_602_length_1334_cov_80.158244_g563_i0:323-1054(+)